MKKIIILGLILLLICLALFLLLRDPVRPLVDICPAITTGRLYGAELSLAGESAQAIDLPEETLRAVLRDCQVKKGHKTLAEPDIAICLRVNSGQETYLLVLGHDRSIAVADSENKRTFWTQVNGDAFGALYRAPTTAPE